MENNYVTQARQAQKRFLSYDQAVLIDKLGLPFDENWLYPTMLCRLYRIHRTTGAICRREKDRWIPGDYREVMTLLDLVCDSQPNRSLSHRWKAMGEFGHLFHTAVLEETAPWTRMIEAKTHDFRRACQALEGRPFPQGDISYAIELFDGLAIVVQFWLGDEEFPSALRFLWDEKALQYLKYETMYFAKDLLLTRLEEEMG